MESYKQRLRRKHEEDMMKAIKKFEREGGEVYMARNGESGEGDGGSFGVVNRKRRGKARGPGIRYSEKQLYR